MEFLEIITAVRVFLFVGMLGIAGIMDVKSRKIPDVLWLVFGGIGAVLYLWDYSVMTTPYHVIAMLTSAFVGVAIWRWKIAGTADAFAVIAMAIILPVHYEFVMMPILVLVLVFFVMSSGTIIYNVVLNLSDVLRRKSLFSEFKDELFYRKAFAFVSSHRKRKYERFVIPAETFMSITPNKKSFRFFPSRNNVRQNSQMLMMIPSKEDVYIQNIPPMIVFLFGVAVFLLLPEILSMLF